ncbi:MAG: polymerase sigma-70 factor [Myxococcaceae bacterium]|nr:polymerase sigma-70 factor [Myxococcaceae bacterium]
MTSAVADLATFEACRPDLLALAYRMLGDVGRAQDIVQEAWLRWHGRDSETVVESPKAFLVTVVTRLSLNELGSARARREESRGGRLPEPVDLGEGGLDQLEQQDQLSMAFLVMLERLTPAERAVLLLHDVFDFTHDEIASLVGRTAPACRKLLERARESVLANRRMFTASREEHARLLHAFAFAASRGDVPALVDLLAADALLITDGGPGGRVVGRTRNLSQPLEGAARIAAFVAKAAGRVELRAEPRTLNGQASLVFYRDAEPFAALLLAVADGKVQRVFFHADPARLPAPRPGSAAS